MMDWQQYRWKHILQLLIKGINQFIEEKKQAQYVFITILQLNKFGINKAGSADGLETKEWKEVTSAGRVEQGRGWLAL